MYTETIIFLRENATYIIETLEIKMNLQPYGRFHKISNSFKCVHYYNKVPIDIQTLPLNKFK